MSSSNNNNKNNSTNITPRKRKKVYTDKELIDNYYEVKRKINDENYNKKCQNENNK